MKAKYLLGCMERKQKAKDEYENNKNRRNKWVRPALGDLKFEPQVIIGPLANQGSSRFFYTLHTIWITTKQSSGLNHTVQRHQNTLGITNYICSFLDSSKHEGVEAL